MSAAFRQPSDAAVRERALDPGESFLVQAPAGSGKTELLIQRFLRLLAVVDEPEEILAVTFTRKATGEMRSRILEALDRARQGQVPDAPHLQRGYQLARAAVARESQRNWDLAGQPARLRIETIDSVNAWLGTRSPLAAGSAALRKVLEDATPLYAEAARRTIALAGDDHGASDAVRRLLEHFDNRAELMTRLLVDMLGTRDQWLRHLGVGPVGDAERVALEHALTLLVEARLREVDDLLPAAARAEIVDVLSASADCLAETRPESERISWRDRRAFPAASGSEIDCWRSLADAMLTKDGNWRKPGGLNVSHGFPPSDKQLKSRMAELLVVLGEVQGLDGALESVRNLPEPRYRDSQWQVLKALIQILPVSAALLQNLFEEKGVTDFGQIAAEALYSLTGNDQPTELAMTMDSVISHILLDEYQDTSRSQQSLLLALTAGWQPGDGHSLFLVGDPMQSIYRFREAEVSVYLEARTQGVGGLPLRFLQLTTNFRSDPSIVDWVNQTFGQLLPAEEDRMTGAVPYAPSLAFNASAESAGVHWHPLPYGDRDSEAREVVETVRQCSLKWPEQTIGILVHSRAHARLLGPLLRAEGIAYSAPNLEQLTDDAGVLDLIALTRALAHRGDRIAWLAVLRAPWCGLLLTDLHKLASADRDSSIWTLLQDDALLAGLTTDGQARVQYLRKALWPWLQRRGACSLRDLVEGAWLALGGPATLAAAAELEPIDEFFRQLDQVDTGGDFVDVNELLEVLGGASVTRLEHDSRVQLMTMHKAKGLEFDTVLLPGLGYRTRGDSRRLLAWTELPVSQARATPLVMAPLHAQGADKDTLYELLWEFEQRRSALERDRLLYVATTRARQRLHLFAALKSRDGEPVPYGGSLLQTLWPVAAGQLQVPAELPLPDAGGEEPASPDWHEPRLRRLPAEWISAQEVTRPAWLATEAAASVEYEWATLWARHVGTVVHRWLQEFAETGIEEVDAAKIRSAQPAFRRQLQKLGTPAADLERATARVAEALLGCLMDSRGRWLLSRSHAEAHSELALTVADGDAYRQLRIDRLIVEPDGTRWVIDYKTSIHEGTELEAFLVSETERYRDQLAAYCKALQQLDGRPSRAALYFPLHAVFREVPLPAAESGAG